MNTLPSVAGHTTTLHTSARGGPTLLPVKDGLWRVVDRTGSIVGHIQKRTDADGDRFAARRLIAATRTMELGVFWRIDDAAECFW
jgi:hypothetical protein